MAAALLCIAAPSAPLALTGEQTSGRSVVIYTADERDARIGAMRQALAFWNQTLSDMDLQPRFLDPEVVVSAPVKRTLETYAVKISKDGWRLSPEAEGLEPPAALIRLRGDLLMLLSTEHILSFAWPIAGHTRYFVAIRTDRSPPLNDPRVAVNVIAHELGHTLGLTHNGTSTLMCGTCEMSVSTPKGSIFLPLSVEDRVRLLDLH